MSFGFVASGMELRIMAVAMRRCWPILMFGVQSQARTVTLAANRLSESIMHPDVTTETIE